MPRIKGAKDLKPRVRPPEAGAAMSFAEIGSALGITRQAAELYFRNGIRKMQASYQLRDLLMLKRGGCKL